jgi:hypothetical protein
MNLLKHEISIDMLYDNEGKLVYQKDLNTVEKIKKIQPVFYHETKKVKVKKETKDYYIVIEVDEDGDKNEIYISKTNEKDRIFLNIPFYPEFTLRGFGCNLYTLDEPEEIDKGMNEVYNYFKNKFVIEAAINENLLASFKRNI